MRYHEILEKVQEVINENAKVQKGSASMKLQRCFAVKGGINGLLDVARRTYCELIDDMETMAKGMSEEYGFPLRVVFNASRGYHFQISGGKKTPLINLRVRPDCANFLYKM